MLKTWHFSMVPMKTVTSKLKINLPMALIAHTLANYTSSWVTFSG